MERFWGVWAPGLGTPDLHHILHTFHVLLGTVPVDLFALGKTIWGYLSEKQTGQWGPQCFFPLLFHIWVLCQTPCLGQCDIYQNGSKFSRHSRHPTSWNWSRTGLLTCAFFVDCFLMQEVGWGQKLDFWELPALKVNIVPWMVLLGTSKLVLNFRKVPEDYSDSQVEVKVSHPPHL